MIKCNPEIDDPLVHSHIKGQTITRCGIDLSSSIEKESNLTENDVSCLICLEKLVDKA